jgi:DNA repair exonuclease SbcCD ATPase subunit
LEDKRRELTSEEVNLRRDLKELEEQEKLFKKIKRLEGELAKLEKTLRIWRLLDNYVFAESMFPRSLLKSIVEDLLTSEVNRILSRIFPEASINLRVSEGGKGVELQIYINNVLRDRLTLSGGEKTLIGFAIRLGISSLVSHLHSGGTTPDFIIIDEGFGPLDEENKNLIAEMLGSLIEEEMYSQVIVISHETELKNHPVFKSIVDVTKEKGYSRLRIRV